MRLQFACDALSQEIDGKVVLCRQILYEDEALVRQELINLLHKLLRILV